ncbi:Transmembrane family 220, helix [Reichenbachiella agariperforans]|uniref:Transmembrane family 220, helix n=1 Tax=Reichenbachiella agariperforans TaxID=156994 RepID=A0A1M6VIZ5_REIAG|nr:transmembrane 220 family protein [Reichenbachiella agariperforans]SHK81324.1 Transmembrane family 220, helix [Reichenbachiella agariperforans]
MKTKLISILYFLIFGAFAYLQLNDPDPLFWVAIYGLVAVVSAIRLFGFSHPRVFLGITIFLVGIACFYIPGFVEYLVQPNKNEIVGEMVYKKPYIEETREFIGLLIAAASTFHQYKIKS